MREAKPPVAIRVKSFNSFTRLALALTDSPPLLWEFKHDGKRFLGTFSVYMSWKGDIPLFAYIRLRGQSGPFLAYKSDVEKEECYFTNNIEDTKYMYAPIIKLRNAPAMFKDSMDGKWPSPKKPLGVELDSLYSLVRLLYLISAKEFTSFPVWSFRKKGKRFLGVCVPFERYYEANALPVFFYVRVPRLPEGPFIRYATSKLEGETLEYTTITGDAKYFYAKVIDLEDMPLFPMPE